MYPYKWPNIRINNKTHMSKVRFMHAGLKLGIISGELKLTLG
jgi:hypothetical protein